MLDVKMSFNFNFLLFNIGDCTCIVHRYSVAWLFVCVFCLSIIRMQHISRGDVTADLSRETSRCDVTFSRLYTPCYSETKDVITSKIQCLLRQNILLFIAYAQYTKHVTFCLPSPISVTVSISHTPHTAILFTAIPQHIVISSVHCIGYTAPPNTIHSPSEMHCNAIMIHFD
jgi:hypothetical protein